MAACLPGQGCSLWDKPWILFSILLPHYDAASAMESFDGRDVHRDSSSLFVYVAKSRGRSSRIALLFFRGSVSLCRSGAYVAPRAAGRTLMHSRARNLDEVVQACFAPCM
jgi:hypothetical protein